MAVRKKDRSLGGNRGLAQELYLGVLRELTEDGSFAHVDDVVSLIRHDKLHLGVTASAVQRGLHRLKAKGLVESRASEGYRIVGGSK